VRVGTQISGFIRVLSGGSVSAKCNAKITDADSVLREKPKTSEVIF
jgi:hypothetical protein